MKKIALVFLFLSVTVGFGETGNTVSAKPLLSPVMEAKVVNGQKACNPETVCSPMDDRIGPPILNHEPDPRVEAAQLAGTPPVSPQRAATPPMISSSGSAGPRYDVTSPAFGAMGDGKMDDTNAIQAAFNACWTTTTNGGIVEFPGHHTYVISSTINAYDGCRIEGVVGNVAGGYTPSAILWNGPASAVGTTLAISQVDVEINCTNTDANGVCITGGTTIYSPAFPKMAGTIQNRIAPYYATIAATNSLTAGQWVEINSLTSQIGSQLNRCIGQVASATSSSLLWRYLAH